MQRILQPGEIEALDHTSFPRILLPQVSSLFAERAARLRQLANGNPIADYLLFVAQIMDAQHKAAATIEISAPDAELMARAQEHSMPLLPAVDTIDPAWQAVLDNMLDTLQGSEGLPAPLQPLLKELRALTPETRADIAKKLLQKEVAARHVGMAPFIMAALQVTFAKRSASLSARDVPYTDPASICPVCASEPVASVIRIGGKVAGHRYAHCGTCACEWHMVRVKCTHCESTKGIHYQGIDGSGEEVLAETCDECGSYRKIVNQEKNPMVEPLVDDLASLMLDLLMSETQFQRASANPLLFVAVAEEQQGEADHELVDPAA
ncbi:MULTISPECIES: formate dehydrogenase accessory protein FdhE [Comamonas]|uniref:Protein FdhE homolog n=1 Tax=Comamonas thiooxydans TaxID=363952 RepID=A0A0E3BXR5_9BURK|nr:formate dehydrogenase accessory protein FdhE [Comamonas thiooxydans]KGG89010.1 formate dehydrogenase accessory protein FdhE [Comamonas thiooxydans]KGH08599.1 formate dehydrogenase accessory protein FdhE [Comamonas thiooxydans]KGH15230.1 formate dehydrogenase accessory protein FdhE [Comamonas thiooxydans]KGH20355.1 formate dehydrogenase accessory protein FdhE [Comamonas thiooxydans]CUA93045.1 formate dehydrogenase accessory protein FdhE [Comamonas thiooxydans]